MKNEQSRKCKKWRFLLLSFLLLAFTTTKDTKSEYNVARAAYSITTGDIDLDGDQDIIIGHIYNSQTEWSGISTLSNNGECEFIVDSSYLYDTHGDVILNEINHYGLEVHSFL